VSALCSRSRDDPLSSIATAQAPTRARFGVIYFGAALAIVQYIDRVCISQAAPQISQSLALSKEQMGWVFSAFTLAYALFEIPTGWLGDRFGPRRTLLRVVLWWSFFTAATGCAWSRASLIATRFLFGMGEAGCFPNLTRAFATWLRPEEKARAQGILWMCARWGGAITPFLVAMVLRMITWRVAFALFGGLGVVWAFLFHRWFRDDPKDHPGVNPAELALVAGNPPVARHDSVPWDKFLASRTTWLLWAQYFLFSYCWYFYVTWLPTYLKDEFGGRRGDVALALMAGIPLFGGGLGNLLSGLITPALTRRVGSLLRARRLLAFSGFSLAAAAFLLPARVHDPALVMAAMGLASLAGDLSMPCSWGACMDVGGKFSGTFSGSMNMMGNLGGALGPVVVGYVVGSTGSYALAFDLSAGVYFLAGLCWLFIDAVTPLAPADDARGG